MLKKGDKVIVIKNYMSSNYDWMVGKRGIITQKYNTTCQIKLNGLAGEFNCLDEELELCVTKYDNLLVI